MPFALSLLIDCAIEVRLKAQTYFEALADGPGPVTARGRRARIAEHHRREVETFAHLVSQIGLHRDAKRIDPHDAVRLAVEKANRK